MRKKSFTEAEKIALVIASMGDQVKVTDFCVKHGIARSSLYAWRKTILESLSVTLFRKNSHHFG